ncbi:MAG: YdaU family protein [Actinomycetia bacterium]|nr:YdaU family protein [Actinomycetes bacterium]
MKAPYFPFYPGDYLADTMGLSCCEHGVYLLLLAVSWQRGPLPDDMDHLARLAANPPVEALRYVLQNFWTRSEQGWINSRLEAERQKLIEFKERQSEAGKKANAARWGNKDPARIRCGSPSDPNHNHNHNQNHNQGSFEEAKASSSSTTAQKTRRRSTCPYQKIVDLYHEHLPMCRQVASLTAARKSSIRARWESDMPDLETWGKYFAYASRSQFLTGQVEPSNGRKRFQADLDWLIRESNVTKVEEGKYHG